MSETRPGPVHLQESALAGDYAMVSGHPAWFLAQALEHFPGGLEALLERSRLTDAQRRSVLRAVSTLGHAGERYRVNRTMSVSNGSPPGEAATLPSSSEEMELTASETAAILGVGEHRVRQLIRGGVLAATRTAGGRWKIKCGDAIAYRDRNAA